MVGGIPTSSHGAWFGKSLCSRTEVCQTSQAFDVRSFTDCQREITRHPTIPRAATILYIPTKGYKSKRGPNSTKDRPSERGLRLTAKKERGVRVWTADKLCSMVRVLQFHIVLYRYFI
ncbi:hypothetical protein AVEN_118100-1 [Araneus ventricosus]|uniref:Uncharacterized protein n=1 Tax=Araneus ventricosus TaxID=182803 RepID=A0A4Y2J209_ARAVE|nr:hypothetical protein AVEN_118100-1 [Araneus ventricosus]